ncbi:MAG: 16S rRNA processing protein RimM, partial [Gammaproteobacteria bacterium]|nr:16S rRNA processing protein RimM [Gammaproteobacteria bacterium]
EVAPTSGSTNLLVAFTDETVPEVDIKKRRLVLVPPEEFEE